MVDTDTFLATLYAMVDDFCKIFLPTEGHAGHRPLSATAKW